MSSTTQASVACLTASGEVTMMTPQEVQEKTLESLSQAELLVLRKEVVTSLKGLYTRGDKQTTSLEQRLGQIDDRISALTSAVGAGESAQTLLLRGELAEQESKLKNYFDRFGRYTLDHFPCREVLGNVTTLRKLLNMTEYEVPVKRCPAYGCTDPNCACPEVTPAYFPPEPERPSRFERSFSSSPPESNATRLYSASFTPESRFVRSLLTAQWSLKYEQGKLLKRNAMTDELQKEIEKKLSALETCLEAFAPPKKSSE